MWQPNQRRVRVPTLVSGASCALAGWLLAGVARAESLAPESPYRVHEPGGSGREPESAPEWAAEPETKTSLFRVSVGPALLIEPASPGLLAALDVGRHAVGARLSAALMRAETERGLASYGGELWVDLGHRYPLHPVLGAGVSLLHGGALGRRGNSGAALLRAGIEYELPIDEADARVGVDLVSLVPAIATERTEPWFLGSVTIGAGF